MIGRKFVPVAVLGILMISCISLFGMNAVADPFGQNRVVISANMIQWTPRMAVTGSGTTATVFVVWADYQWGGTTSDIAFAKSADSGYTFSPQMRVNMGDYALNNSIDSSPDITIDGTNVYIVWQDTSLGQPHIFLRKSIDSGSNWGTAVQVTSTPTGSDGCPKIAASGSNVYIAWQGKNTEGILAALSTNGGASFGAAATVCGPVNGYIMGRPDVAMDNTNVYVVYDNSDGPWGSQDIYCSKATLGSTSFGAGIDVSNSPNCMEQYASVDASSDGVYVAWEDYRNAAPDYEWTGTTTDDADIYFAKSTDKGVSFGAAVRANDDPIGNDNQQYGSSIAVDGTGAAYIAWSDERNGNYDVYFTKHSGTSFSVNGRVNEFQATPADQMQPSIDISTDNVAYCSWTDTRNAAKGRDIYCAHAIPNTLPTAATLYSPDQMQTTSMRLTWQGNIESDFASYEVHMSTTASFTPSGATLNKTITNQATTEYTVQGLSPGTRYYFKMVVTDFDGLSSTSNEVFNSTLSVNQRPRWLKDIEDLDFDEDNATQGHLLLNLSNGYIWDDKFNGFDLIFSVNTTSSNVASQNIAGKYEKNGTYHYVTFTSKADWVGSEEFWIFMSDVGADGTPSVDDLYNISSHFMVSVNNVNDRPVFDKVYSGVLWEEKISDKALLNMTKIMEKGRQNAPFTFTVKCKDPDSGDAITYKWYKKEGSVETALADPEANLDSPTLAADFTYTPDNFDGTNIDGLSGWISFNITAQDKAGAKTYFYLGVTIDNGNDEPVLLTIIEGTKETAISSLSKNYVFTVNEGARLNFSVVAVDLDPKDVVYFYCDKLNMSLVSTTKFNDTYNSLEVPHFMANFTYVPTIDDLMFAEFKGIKISIDDKHTGYDEVFVDLTLLNKNDPPNAPKIVVTATLSNEQWQKDSSYSDKNNNEDLNFTATATDPDLIDIPTLTYSWDFGDGSTASGRYAIHKFTTAGNYTINCTVTDKGGLKNYTAILLYVQSDDDADNDRMSDTWEVKEGLDPTIDDSVQDPDEDEFSNYDEFRMKTDPHRDNNLPPVDDDDDDDTGFQMPIWAIIVIGVVVALLVFGIVIFFIIRRQNQELDAEDKKMDEYCKKQEEKLAESKKIYGLQVAGAQATSNIVHTQTVDLNKLTEEEKMFIAIGDGKATVGDLGGKKIEEPQMVSAGSGPLFDNSAPRLEFSTETIKLETLSTPKDDHDIVIETVTLGMKEDPDPNKNFTKSAPKRQ